MLKSVTFRSTLAAVAWAVSFSAFAMANGLTQVDIPAGNLVPALEALEKQAAVELLFQPEQLKSFHTRGVKGTYEPKDAVRLLLKGTPLEVRTDPSGAMVIVPFHAAATRTQAQSQAAGGSGQAADSRSSLQLAQATTGQASGPASVAGASNSQENSTPGALQEVIVTAQKRAERLEDVPVPVSVLEADTLVATNQLRLADYYNQVTGLNYTGSQVIIRGLTTASANPTVGVTVDDVPFGPSTQLDFGGSTPDLDPSDLARIEVLRGPQGTLYGANSLGGLIKYVTIDPSTDTLSGRVEAGSSSVQNGPALGYDVHAAINVPLGDTLAFRTSGFTRESPGYVDNAFTGQNGVNRLTAYGGLFSALWRPSDTLSLKLSALLQNQHMDGSPIVERDVGPLSQNFIRGAGVSDSTSEVYTATLKAKLGTVDLTSISAYNIYRTSGTSDYSVLGSIADTGIPGTGFNGFGVSGVPYVVQATTKKFTQEIRLTSSIGEHLEWLLGGFYGYEDAPQAFSDLYASVPTTGKVVGTLAHYTNPSTNIDEAVFGDLTVHITDRLNIQFGGRESSNRQSYSEVDTGPFVPILENAPSPWVYPLVHSKDNSFTYLVTPQFRVSPDFMVYARLASGYRDGGPNFTVGNYPLPLTYQPDKTQNYEIGAKGDFLDHALSIDASVYYIQWKDIQLSLENPIDFIQYDSNGSQAKSQGIELSVQAKPLTGLTIAGWIALNDAELTQALPPSSAAIGVAGDRLPFSERVSGNLSLEQDFPLGAQMTGFVGTSASYVGPREGPFPSSLGASPERQDLPGYVEVFLRAGVKRDLWAVNVYVNNVADKRGVLDGGIDFPNYPDAWLYIQPRTVGLSVSRSF